MEKKGKTEGKNKRTKKKRAKNGETNVPPSTAPNIAAVNCKFCNTDSYLLQNHNNDEMKMHTLTF